VVDGVKAATSDATTTFVTDANVVATTVPNPVYVPRNLYMSSSDNYKQEIIQFLEKPQLMVSGSLSSTDTVSTFTAINFPGHFGTKPIWTQKLNGYFGIRMDLVFRMVVNATRFQQGRYMLLWKPFGGAAVDAKNSAIMAGHVMTLVQRSQMPHAEIDINCDTEIEFLVPFSNMFNFCHIRTITAGTLYNTLGAIQLYPYVALSAVAGSLSCGYTIYVSARNIELISAATPQMSSFKVTRKGKNETNIEQDSANMGPISSIMAKVSAASSILTGVPLLSSYMSTTSWMADIIGRTASTFGYSRPINLEHANRMTKDVFPYFANVDGPDNSYPLSLSYKNELAPLVGISPTDRDEMDFAFLVTIPTYQTTLTWETAVTQPAGFALSSWGVSPLATSYPSTNVNTNSLSHLAPFQYVARFFKYWRGTMVYKFKVVKTEFHSGRLAFSFNPQTTLATNTISQAYTDLPYIHREIIDIRLENEIVLKVPFVSDTPWKPVLSGDDSFKTGVFAIHVVDPLVAPDTVSQRVSIIVEMCMSSDAEFAVPAEGELLTPFYGAAPQMGGFDNAPLPESNSCNEVNDTVGSMSSLDGTLINAALCMGEKITSFRKFLRKPSPNIYVAATPTLATQFISPFVTTAASQNGAVNVLPTTICDLYGSISSLYLYSRGSVRLKFITADPSPSTVGYSSGGINPVVSLFYKSKILYKMINLFGTPTSPMLYAIPGPALAQLDIGNLHTIMSGDENQEIQIPHYHYMPVRNNFEHVSNTQHPYAVHNGVSTGNATNLSIHRLPMTTNSATLESTPLKMYRATADDCTFAYFLSVPPMTPIGASF
jgi:hypothetical protein